MSPAYEKPLPRVDEINKPYWDAAKRHELVIQRCDDCGTYRYPIGIICPGCLSDKLKWVKISGRGKVYTWVVIHQVYHPAFAGDVPYAVVAVELEEGPRMSTRLVGCGPENITIGMPVKADFIDVTPEITLPVFRPV